MAVVPAAINAVLGSLTLAGAFWLSGILALATGFFAWAKLPRSVEPKPKQAIEWRSLWWIPPELRAPMTIAALFGIGYGAFLQFLPFPTGPYFFLPALFFAVFDLAALDFVALDLTIFFFTAAYSSSFVVVARSIAG